MITLEEYICLVDAFLTSETATTFLKNAQKASDMQLYSKLKYTFCICYNNYSPGTVYLNKTVTVEKDPSFQKEKYSSEYKESIQPYSQVYYQKFNDFFKQNLAEKEQQLAQYQEQQYKTRMLTIFFDNQSIVATDSVQLGDCDYFLLDNHNNPQIAITDSYSNKATLINKEELSTKINEYEEALKKLKSFEDQLTNFTFYQFPKLTEWFNFLKNDK